MKNKKHPIMLLIAIMLLFSPTIVMAAGNMATFVGHNYGNGDIDSRSAATNAQKNIYGKNIQLSTNPTIAWLKGTASGTKRMEADILLFAGHGANSAMQYYTRSSNGNITNMFYIRANNASSNVIALDNYNMKNVKLAIFAGCETAFNSNSNLAKSTYNLGARSTIGWIPDVDGKAFISWLNRFTFRASSGIGAALIYADSISYIDNGVKSYRKYGNWNATTTFSSTNTNNFIETTNQYIQVNEREYITNYSIDEKIINNEISHYIKDIINPNFNIDDYNIEKTIQDEKIIYDITLKVNNIRTTLGYVIFVENDIITNIFDNTENNNMQTLKNKINIKEKTNYLLTIEASKEKSVITNANLELDLFNFNITEQTIEKFYENGNLYYLVMTTIKNNDSNTIYKTQYLELI